MPAHTVRQPRSKLPCDSTPCFPGSRRTEIQPFGTLLLLRPDDCEQRAGRGGDFCFCSELIFPPRTDPRGDFFLLRLFFVVVVFVLRAGHIFRRSKVDASVLASHTSVFAPCAAPPWQWIDFGVFFSPLPSLPSPPADLRLEQVEGGKKTLPPTCDSLQLHVLPDCHFKRTCCQMFLHILGL